MRLASKNLLVIKVGFGQRDDYSVLPSVYL